MKKLNTLVDQIKNNESEETISNFIDSNKAALKEEINSQPSSFYFDLAVFLMEGKISFNITFFESLWKLNKYIYDHEIFLSLVIKIWIAFFNQISDVNNKKELLNSIFEENTLFLWNFIQVLPEFCSKANIEPELAADWFVKLIEKTANDGANYLVHQSVDAYMASRPDSLIMILKLFLNHNIEGIQIDYAGQILGILRARAVKKETSPDEIDEIEEVFSKSIITNIRKCYYRSKAVLYKENIISIKDLFIILDSIIKDSTVDIEESFILFYKCILAKQDDHESTSLLFEWLFEHIDSAQSAYSKFYVVDLIWRLFRNKNHDILNTHSDKIVRILIVIQPIPKDNKNTWHILQYFLVDRIKETNGLFEKIIIELLSKNHDDFLSIFEDREYDYLRKEIIKQNKSEFTTKLLISRNRYERRFAFILLERTDRINLSKSLLGNATTVELKILLKELIHRPLAGDKIAFYIPEIAVFFIKNKDVIREFLELVMDQAVNYPGACLVKWRGLPDSSEEFNKVILKAESYFEQLKLITNLPAKNIIFPGYKKAVEKHNYEFNRLVREGAEKNSVFFSLTKHLNIIYGKLWAIYNNGIVGEDNIFKEFSTSMEFPRLEFIDPEGMELKRIEANAWLRQIEEDDNVH